MLLKIENSRRVAKPRVRSSLYGNNIILVYPQGSECCLGIALFPNLYNNIYQRKQKYIQSHMWNLFTYALPCDAVQV
jgi:hypothetical protein